MIKWLSIAYAVSKIVFYEYYDKKSNSIGNRGRLEERFASGTMARGLDFRPSIDLMFLAILDNEARKAGDTVLAGEVQVIVE